MGSWYGHPPPCPFPLFGDGRSRVLGGCGVVAPKPVNFAKLDSRSCMGLHGRGALTNIDIHLWGWWAGGACSEAKFWRYLSEGELLEEFC